MIFVFVLQRIKIKETILKKVRYVPIKRKKRF